jgi:uncharacterized protein YaeQ
MALTATIFHVLVNVSDVDRGVYEQLDLRLARHPSETSRFMLLRLFAYCLSYEEGIAFSKGGLSSAEEPPVAIHDPTGVLLAWIDVGSPSAERLHRASKAARRVALFSAAELGSLRREAARQRIHRIEEIAVYRLEPSLLEALEAKVEKSMSFDVVHTEGQLYVTVEGETIEGTVTRASLVADADG